MCTLHISHMLRNFFCFTPLESTPWRDWTFFHMGTTPGKPPTKPNKPACSNIQRRSSLTTKRSPMTRQILGSFQSDLPWTARQHFRFLMPTATPIACCDLLQGNLIGKVNKGQALKEWMRMASCKDLSRKNITQWPSKNWDCHGTQITLSSGLIDSSCEITKKKLANNSTDNNLSTKRWVVSATAVTPKNSSKHLMYPETYVTWNTIAFLSFLWETGCGAYVLVSPGVKWRIVKFDSWSRVFFRFFVVSQDPGRRLMLYKIVVWELICILDSKGHPSWSKRKYCQISPANTDTDQTSPGHLRTSQAYRLMHACGQKLHPLGHGSGYTTTPSIKLRSGFRFPLLIWRHAFHHVPIKGCN